MFENSFLMELERLIEKADLYREAAFGFIDAVLAVKGGVSDLWGSASGVWSAASGVFAAVRSLFDLDAAVFPDRGGYSAAAFQAASRGLYTDLETMIRQGLYQAAGIGGDLPAADGCRRYLAAAQKADELIRLPDNVLRGQNSRSRLTRIAPPHVKPAASAVRLLAVAVLADVAVRLIEADGENMNAPELTDINRDLRRRCLAAVGILRETERAAVGSGNAGAVYIAVQQTTEALRETAGRLNVLVAAAINQKPPLVVRVAPLDGTVHQLAHEFYGDLTRAGELVRLNPHITHPAFIRRGILVNCYAK